MSSPLRSLMPALLLLAPAARAQSPVLPTALVEFEASRKGLWKEGADVRELLARMKGRAGQLGADHRRAQAAALKVPFAQSLLREPPPSPRLFTTEKRPLCLGLLEVLGALGSGFTDRDVAALLPRAGALDKWDLDTLQGQEFRAFAREYGGSRTAGHILGLLDSREVRANPAWFLGLAWLGQQTRAGADGKRIAAALQAAYLNRTPGLSEPEIVSLIRPLSHQRWRAPEVKGLRDLAFLGLAQHLFRLASIEDLPEARRLTSAEFLFLAALRPSWTDWSGKLGRQLKDRISRNDRTRGLLAAVVSERGDHFAVLEKLLAPDRDSNLFVYLHGPANAEESAPWKILNRSKENFRHSVRLMKGLFSLKGQASWSVPLLDLLEQEYYESDPEGFFNDVLRPVVRAAPENHEVRRELLARVAAGKFPRPAQRWALAWDAAGEKRLLAELPVGAGRVSALRFLAGICRTMPLPPDRAEALGLVNKTYGKLLGHVYERLFEVAPADAPLDGPPVLRELSEVFRELARLRKEHAWKPAELTGVAAFWERVTGAFEAAVRARDRQRMTAVLRLLFRLSAVNRDAAQVRYLAETACSRVFGVRPDTPFRSLPGPELDLQVRLFDELEPAIRDALQGIREDGGGKEQQRFLDEIVSLFEGLYRALLRADRFLGRAGGGKGEPWLRLAAEFSTPEGRSAARGRLLEELTKTPFLNSPAAVRALVVRCLDDQGVRSWLAPGRLRLSENINLPLLKGILDEAREDLRNGRAKAGVVLGLFIGGLNDERLWLTSCTYDSSAKRQTAEVHDRAVLLPYLAGLLAYHEAVAAPFKGSEDFDVATRHSYSPQAGPAFDLPDGSWERSGVSGQERLRLYRAAGKLLGEKAATRQRLWLASLVLLLPNRESHVAEAEAGSLAEYRRVKEGAVRDLEALLPGASDNEERVEILKVLTRLRFSFAPDVPGKSAAVEQAESQLARGGERGQRLLRVLMYEEIFLRLCNVRARGPGGAVRHRLNLLLEHLCREHGIRREQDDFRRFATLAQRAAFARDFLSRVGPEDIIAFYPLLQSLAARPGGSGGLNPQTAADALWAYCLLLPFYGLDQDALLVPPADGARRQDRLILFCLLSSAAKSHLASLVVPGGEEVPGGLDDGTRAWMAQILVDHNNLCLTMAGKVFEDRKLLVSSLEDNPYSVETLDFAVLYQRRTRFTLNAKELLSGAVSGAHLNFRLAQRLNRAGQGDRAVIEFLFRGRSWGNEGAMPSLDSVLRVCARVAGDPRHDGDPDQRVLRAAETFKKQARDFIETPPPLPWFGARGGPALDEAATYLVACEGGAEAILRGRWPSWVLPGGSKKAVAKWQRDAVERHARLWQHLLLPAGDDPLWKTAFVRSFCSVSVGEGQERPTPAAMLLAQRELFGRLVGGDAEVPTDAEPLRLRGLRRSLAEMDRLSRQAPASPGARYLQAYWQAAGAVLKAVQTGEGLEGDVPFLARPFMTSPGGVARPLTERDVIRCLEKEDPDGLFAALDWPNVLDRRYPDPRIRGLLGGADRLGRIRPGLGVRGLDPQRLRPGSYREAIWLSLSAHAAGALGRPICALDCLVSEIRNLPSLQARLERAEARSGDVFDRVRQVIAFVRYHNERMTTLARRSGRIAEAARDAPAGGAGVWAGDWAWLRADEVTVGWVRDLAAPGAWRELAAIWAPFGVYARLEGDEFREPEALGLTPAAWVGGGPEVHDFALLHLARLAENNARGEIRLVPARTTLYEEAARNAPLVLLGRETAPALCRDRVAEWAALRWWIRAARARRQEIAGLPNHQFGALAPRVAAEFARADLGPLGNGAVKRCHWSAPASREWCQRYTGKMAFVCACAAACPSPPVRDKGAGWTPAPVALREFACRSEPCASPFLAEFDGRRVRLVRAEPELHPDRIRRLPDAQRTAVLRMLRNWLLLQRVVTPKGQPEVIRASFMGYVDLVDPPRE
jgi:hypothetical protein